MNENRKWLKSIARHQNYQIDIDYRLNTRKLHLENIENGIQNSCHSISQKPQSLLRFRQQILKEDSITYVNQSKLTRLNGKILNGNWTFPVPPLIIEVMFTKVHITNAVKLTVIYFNHL